MFRRLSMKNGAIERCSIKKHSWMLRFRFGYASFRCTTRWSIKSFWELLATSFPFFSNFSSFFLTWMKRRTDITDISDGSHRRVKLPRKKKIADASTGFHRVPGFHSGYFGDTSRYHVKQTIAHSSNTSIASVFLKVSSGDVYWKRDNGEHVTLLKI